MEKITITREEFKERIVNNPRGYAIVRAMKENPEKFKDTRPMMVLVEEMTQAIMLAEIEEELFGQEEQHE